MKRSPDLLRELLLYFERKPNDHMEVPVVEGFSKRDIDYHLVLMHEAGLIRAEAERTESGRVIRVYPFSLTWQGHELLDAARNATAWKRVKKLVLSKTGSMSVELLRAALVAYAKTSVGLPAA